MAKKKETKEKDAVKKSVANVGVRDPIQSTYAEGDIPLGSAVYTADEVDALFAAKDHTHSSIQSPDGNTKIKAVDSGKGFIETYGEAIYDCYDVTVDIPQVPGASARIRLTDVSETVIPVEILSINNFPGATVNNDDKWEIKVNGSYWGSIQCNPQWDENDCPDYAIIPIGYGGKIYVYVYGNEIQTDYCHWSNLEQSKELLSSKEISTTDQVPTVPVREVQKNGVALTPDANGAVNVKGVYYATCDTAQGTSVKVATLKNSSETFVLEEGVVVYVRFTNASPTNTSGGSTGICKLNVANTGEKNIYGPTSASLGSSVTYTWNSNAIIGFIYDAVSDCWRALSPSLALNLNCAGVVGVQDQLSKPSVDLTNRRGVATAAILTNNIGLSIAPLWVKNTSTSYTAGDYVMYTDGKLYKAKVDIAANTAWSASNWEAVTVMDEMPNAVSVTDPAIATSTDEGKAADAYHTKQALDGKADLVNGLVPSSQLPSYVDDVLEYDGTNHFPSTGETGKIYVDTNTNKTYRWSGTQYVEISASDVSLTSAGGYPYQLPVGSTSCDINSVSLDGTARSISVNGGIPVYFGDSVSVSGSGPYQLYVNNNLQCYIPVASINTSSNSVTIDGNTLYVPSISISGQTITLDGMGYNMYPISWDSTTRMLDLYGDSMTTLYVSDLEWDATYNRLRHYGAGSSYIIGWEEVSGRLSSTYDQLTIGNKTIYLDGNDLHIGKDSIAIAPSGDILASDIWYDTNRTSTVYSQLQYLFGSNWGALRVGSNGNVLDYSGTAISKGNLKLNGSDIATLSDIPAVYDAVLTLQQNGVQQTTFSANSSSPATFNVDTYSYATTSSLADAEVKVATCIDSYFSLFAGAFVLVEFSDTNTHSAPKLNVNSTGAKPMLSGDGTAFTSWSANQVVPFIYDGSVWRVVGSSYGIDSTPTSGSSNLVTSNGIFQFVGQYALSNGAGISITNSLISVNGTDGHGTTFHNLGGNTPLYIDVDDGSTAQAGIVQLDDTPKEDSTLAATPTSVNTVAKDIAPNWAKANAYAQGAYVTKDGVLYKAKAAIAANTDWNANSWQATSVGGDVATDKSNLKTILAGMPANLDTYDNALQAINVLWNAVYKLAYGTDRVIDPNPGGGAAVL